MSIRAVLLILALAACLQPGICDDAVRPSYGDRLALNLAPHASKTGLDIWMTRDHARTWVMIGRTNDASQAAYEYQTNQKGWHGFHFHPRSGANDSFRPDEKSALHDQLVLGELEQANKNILYSNSRLLSIQYKVRDSSAGASGKFQSWLYFTRDSGQTWQLYGEDPDGVSPCKFETNADGLYGFKIVSLDVAGMREAAPGQDARPDVMVRIDTQPPQVNILSPQAFDLWETGTQRMIRWEATDESLSDQDSASVYVAVGEPADWKLLQAGLPAKGGVVWKIPESANGKVYVQVRAVDKSGNMGQSGTDEPFLTRNILEDMLDPKVRETADMYYETATICRQNRDYPKAVKYFRLCLQLNPYHVRAHNDMALTLLHLNEQRQAFDHFELGLKYSPSNSGLLTNLAKLYMDNSQFDLAGKVLARLVHLYPKSSEGLWLSSLHAYNSGRVDLARDYWKRLTDLDIQAHDPKAQRAVLEARSWLSRTSSVGLDGEGRGQPVNLGLK